MGVGRLGALDDHQMQADPQRRVCLGTADSVGGGGGGDHQAGGLQDAVSVGAFNTFVDSFGKAEIDGKEGDGFHALGPMVGTPPFRVIEFGLAIYDLPCFPERKS